MAVPRVPRKFPVAKLRDHHTEILKRAGSGHTAGQIAAWLASLSPPVRVSDRAIRKFLEGTRKERADATKIKVRDTLAPVVTDDLDELEAARKRARAIEDKAMEGRIVTLLGEPVIDKKTGEPVREPDLEIALKALKQQTDTLDKKLHYAGADANDTGEAVAGVVVLPPEDSE